MYEVLHLLQPFLIIGMVLKDIEFLIPNFPKRLRLHCLKVGLVI